MLFWSHWLFLLVHSIWLIYLTDFGCWIVMAFSRGSSCLALKIFLLFLLRFYWRLFPHQGQLLLPKCSLWQYGTFTRAAASCVLVVILHLWLYSNPSHFHNDPCGLGEQSTIYKNHIGLSILQSLIFCALTSCMPCVNHCLLQIDVSVVRTDIYLWVIQVVICWFITMYI